MRILPIDSGGQSDFDGARMGPWKHHVHYRSFNVCAQYCHVCTNFKAAKQNYIGDGRYKRGKNEKTNSKGCVGVAKERPEVVDPLLLHPPP